MKEFWEFIKNLIDNDTLVILSVLTIATIDPNVREIAIGGLLGVIGMKAKEAKNEKEK